MQATTLHISVMKMYLAIIITTFISLRYLIIFLFWLLFWTYSPDSGAWLRT